MRHLTTSLQIILRLPLVQQKKKKKKRKTLAVYHQSLQRKRIRVKIELNCFIFDKD
jgi:hypothetical protein